jgi:hypothetical protein
MDTLLTGWLARISQKAEPAGGTAGACKHKSAVQIWEPAPQISCSQLGTAGACNTDPWLHMGTAGACTTDQLFAIGNSRCLQHKSAVHIWEPAPQISCSQLGTAGACNTDQLFIFGNAPQISCSYLGTCITDQLFTLGKSGCLHHRPAVHIWEQLVPATQIPGYIWEQQVHATHIRCSHLGTEGT